MSYTNTEVRTISFDQPLHKTNIAFKIWHSLNPFQRFNLRDRYISVESNATKLYNACNNLIEDSLIDPVTRPPKNKRLCVIKNEADSVHFEKLEFIESSGDWHKADGAVINANCQVLYYLDIDID